MDGVCVCVLQGGGHHRVVQGFWQGFSLQLLGIEGERIIATQSSFSSSLYSHLMEGFPLSCLCGLIARRAADVAPSKKFCLACHLGSSESLCRDYCFAPVSSTFLFPLSAISAKLLTLLIGTRMQSDVLFCRICLSWFSNLCRRWELLPLPDPDGAAARVSCKHSQRDYTRPFDGIWRWTNQKQF